MMSQNFGNSSQESLPLSQETYHILLSQIGLTGGELLAGCGTVGLGASENIVIPQVQPKDQPHSMHVSSTRSTQLQLEDQPHSVHVHSTQSNQLQLENQPHSTHVHSTQSNQLQIENEPHSVHVHSTQSTQLQLEDQTLSAHVTSPRSTLPATCSWPGYYNFELMFRQHEKVNKQSPWVYSQRHNKLYVQKDAVCPFSFRTNTLMPDDVSLRAMALFTSPEHASEVVTRCVNHSQLEFTKRIFQAEHLIRSDSPSAYYVKDPETGRHSVVLPFENPPVGESYSTYTFKFVCFSSCAGGPNRRPLTLVFLLEQGQFLLGRITLDLKICSNPVRDRDNAENPRPVNSAPEKSKTEHSSSSISEDLCEILPKKKMEKKSGSEKEFTIRVKENDCYKFLMDMKDLFETRKKFCKLSPETKSFLQIYWSSSDEDSEYPSQG